MNSCVPWFSSTCLHLTLLIINSVKSQIEMISHKSDCYFVCPRTYARVHVLLRVCVRELWCVSGQKMFQGICIFSALRTCWESLNISVQEEMKIKTFSGHTANNLTRSFEHGLIKSQDDYETKIDCNYHFTE